MNSITVNGLKLSSITFGTGGNVDGDTLLKLLDKSYSLGGRTIDTARMYTQLGESSEAVIGRWLKTRGVRDSITLVTKGGFPAQRATPDCIRDDMEQSLDALGCTPDFYLFHRDTPSIAVEEFAQLGDYLVKQNMTKNYGISNWDNGRICELETYAKSNNLALPCISQIQWSLAQSDCTRMGDDTLVCMNKERFTHYEKTNMPVMAFSPQAKGFFSKYAAGVPYSEKVIARFLSDDNLARAQRVTELAQQMGVSAAAIVLAYITSSLPNAVAVVGCLTEEHIEDSLTACKVILTKEQCEWLRG